MYWRRIFSITDENDRPRSFLQHEREIFAARQGVEIRIGARGANGEGAEELALQLIAHAEAVAGGGAGKMRGGRHIQYDKPTPLANLHLSLLNKVGVPMESFADSTGTVDELFEPLSI